MAEMDKLKRSVILLTARKMITEKKSQNEVWKELKKETGFDCKTFWETMVGLTLTKLSRLLPACDLTESIPPEARMTPTDWLLFDTVLVHEDIDLIGQDIKNQKDPKPLVELMFIVHTLNIEGMSGDALVDAWTRATITYNRNRRRCSPMLLQRRWHQLKKATRSNFYNFWFSYRGSDKLLLRTKNKYMPSQLQMAIAQRYTHIITKPFMDWNECIEKKFVILPDDFEKKMRSPQAILKGPVLVEPNIELNNGGSDTEQRQEDSCDSQNSISKASYYEGPHTKIKTEPVNEEETKKPTIFSLSEQLLKRDEQLLSNIDDVGVQVISNDESVVDSMSNSNFNIYMKGSLVTDYNCDDDIIEVTDHKVIPSKETTERKCEKYTLDSNVDYITQMNTEFIQMETDVCLSPSKELDEQIVMPKITSVFGNVNDDTDVLAQVSNISNNKIIAESTSVVPVDKELENINPNNQTDLETTINEKLGGYLSNMKKTTVDERINKLYPVPLNVDEANKIIKNETQINSANPFLDLPAGLTFVDGSIELIDDGIEFVDDGMELDNDDDTTVQAIDLCESTDEESDETKKFDVKLLMDPVVYTTKLDDMKVFKNKKFQFIADKNVIYSAVVESKPKSARSVDNSKNKQIDNDVISTTENKYEIYSHKSSDNEEYIPVVKIKKVKLSSPLLQKPKCRSYNPIQLCKNPDFNTRLKRLTVGFLSSTRNRSLLKMLKPMTIDISKAFETKLVNGTMYLKSSGPTCDVIIEDDLSEKVSAVLPSAMPAQSLIDQTKVNIEDILPSEGKKTNNAKSNDSIFLQRNKAINLPDIENIRHMNQQLFTAQIKPMRVQTTSEISKPPVQLVSSSLLISTKAPDITKILDSHESSNNDLPKLSLISSSDKEPVKQCNQKLRKTPVPSWLSKPFFPKGLKVDRGLLTIDALRKMLSVMKTGKLISENFKDDMLASVIREIELHHSKKEGKLLNQKPTVPEKTKAPDVSRPVPLLIQIPTANKNCDKPNISTANSNRNESKSSMANKNYSKTKISTPNQNLFKAKITPIKPKPTPNIPPSSYRLQKAEMPKITPIKPKPTPNILPSIDNKIKEIVKVKGIDCCWARKKLNNPSSQARHHCPSICFCCCRKEFVAECTAQCAKLKQKSINRNRVPRITDFGHTSPIFLGKNNILLTNAPLPKEMSVLPVLQKKVTTDLVVPRGIQIVLLSNGQLSYTLEPGVKLTKEESATLPAILEAARQQLSPSIMNAFATKSDDVYHIEDAEINHTSELYSNLVQDVTEKTASILPVLQKKVTTDLVVPQGVQIVLLSNGELSYTLEAGGILTKEELASLPAILDAARQQLSSSIINVSATNSDDVCHIQNSTVNRTAENIKTTQSDTQDCNNKTQNAQPITLPDNEVENITNATNTIEKYSLEKKSLKTGTEIMISTLETNKDRKLVESANCDIFLETNVISNGETSATDISSKIQEEKKINLNISYNKSIPATEDASKIKGDMKIKGDNSDISLKSNTCNEGIPATDDASKILNDKKYVKDNINVTLESNTTSNEGIPTTDHLSKIQVDKKVKGDKNGNSLESNVNPNESVPDDANTTQNRKFVEGDSKVISTQCNTNCNEGVPEGVTKFSEVEKSLAVDNSPLSTNKSNLISDLMEMSGISSEDTTLLTNKFLCVKPTVPPLIPLTRTPAAPQTPPRYLQIAANAPPVITTSPKSNIQELCSVTSYAHLKYAYEKNASFFKLDLQTGMVLPIKVSLKKDLTATAFNISAKKPLPHFIDLTDEQDTPEKPVLETENNDEVTPTITTEPVRPLRLFRSVNILERKRANIALKADSKLNMSQVARRQKRKQKLDKTLTRVDTEIRNDVIKYSTLHDIRPLRDDVSSCEESDDEPLAAVLKRRKQIQDTPQKDKGNNFIDMEGVIPANIISGLPQSSSFVSDEENENFQDVQNISDEEQDCYDIDDQQDGQDKQRVESGQEGQDTRNLESGQNIQADKDVKDGQDTENGQNMEDGKDMENEQDVDDGIDMEDGQDVDDGQDMEDEDICILGF